MHPGKFVCRQSNVWRTCLRDQLGSFARVLGGVILFGVRRDQCRLRLGWQIDVDESIVCFGVWSIVWTFPQGLVVVVLLTVQMLLLVGMGVVVGMGSSFRGEPFRVVPCQEAPLIAKYSMNGIL